MTRLLNPKVDPRTFFAYGTVHPLYDDERFEMPELDWSQIVDPYRPENVTPVGYDFTLGKIEKIIGMGTLLHNDKLLPEYREVQPQYRYYRLGPGLYLVEFEEYVKIPANYMGLMWPRSSLVRCGVDMATAIWDAGYEGRSKSTMNVINPAGFTIEPGTRVGHMVLVPCAMASTLYAGQYQGEGLS